VLPTDAGFFEQASDEHISIKTPLDVALTVHA
jgi:hypothetical protein